jgi:2-oxoglutarate dehydrogenase E2 component (dihydrolipoamide succinyltransferase)
MALDIKIPTVGESITEVVIANWRKKDGETVKMNEVLVELESDKASFELQAEGEGVLHITAKEGDTVAIGAVIGMLDGGNGSTPQPETEQPEPQKQPEPEEKETPKPEPQPVAQNQQVQVVEMKVPTVGESINEVTIGTWNKKDGETVQLNDILCEIESDKATFELAAEATGILKIVAASGTTLPIGGLICTIAVSENASVLQTQPVVSQSVAQGKQTVETSEKTYATGTPSPTAQKILSEKGIEPKDVNGTGVDGRITKNDAVLAEKQQPIQEKKPETKQPEVKTPEVKPQAGIRNQRRERMTQLRKTVARRLVAVKNETAMLTTFNEVDMKPVMELRNKYKDKFKEKYTVGLGFMSFFTKACCVALQENPAVNAMIDGDEIVYNDYCDVSVAVSSPRGLVVPVVRNAQEMSFAQIEAEIGRLAVRARDGKLSIEEMTGGTFTITNGGIFGSMLSTPIINAPQTAILGLHNIVERPVVVDGQIVIRPIMYLALSYDHRIIDGKEAVTFLVRVKQLLEDPARLLLEI